VLTESYSKISTYLLETLGANFIFFTILITTTTSIIYFIVISYSITQMDKRYFVRAKIADKKIADLGFQQPPHSTTMKISFRYVINIAKIITGLFLLIFGILMLVLPGQGIITMIVGLSLLPFPGKDKVEQSFLSRKSVRSTLNWIRTKANKEPFIFD
jgi:hypothetical protein